MGKTVYGNELLLIPPPLPQSCESERNVYSVGPNKMFCELTTRPSTEENCCAVDVQDSLSF
jgi:hypothetical protein